MKSRRFGDAIAEGGDRQALVGEGGKTRGVSEILRGKARGWWRVTLKRQIFFRSRTPRCSRRLPGEEGLQSPARQRTTVARYS